LQGHTVGRSQNIGNFRKHEKLRNHFLVSPANCCSRDSCTFQNKGLNYVIEEQGKYEELQNIFYKLLCSSYTRAHTHTHTHNEIITRDLTVLSNAETAFKLHLLNVSIYGRGPETLILLMYNFLR
jgi:hypothetical protein